MQYHDFFSHIIAEGRADRYLPVLTGRGGNYTDQEREYVQRVMSDFKRDDIVQWFLRWSRAVKIVFKNDATPADKIWLEKYKAATQKPENTRTIYGNVPDMEHVSSVPWSPEARSQWMHFLSQPIPEIQNYRFVNQTPHKVMGDFQYFEEEWKKVQEQESQWIDMTSELSYNNAPDDFQVGTVDEIIKLNNGFSWFNLNKAACKKEGSAMGHCGNTAGNAPTDTILSLRNVKKINGRTFARPCVTFILNKKTGALGEMKGRANEKPDAKYHPYILKLFEYKNGNDYLIKDLIGGGYLPESNFSVDDLSDADKNRLYEVRPDLKPMLVVLKTEGVTPKLKQRILDRLSGKSGKIKFVNVRGHEKMYVETWPEMKDFFGSEFFRYNSYMPNFKFYWSVIRGEGTLDDDREVPRESVEELFELATAHKQFNKKAFIRYLIDEETYTAEELRNAPDIFELLYETNSEVIQNLTISIRNVAEGRAYTRMLEYFVSGIDAISLTLSRNDVDLEFGLVAEPEKGLNSPIYQVWDIESAIAAMETLQIDNFSDLFETGLRNLKSSGDMTVPDDGFNEYGRREKLAALNEFYQFEGKEFFNK